MGGPVASGPLTRLPSENFPVALRVLPARYRADLLAVYAFARLVDDIGDEPAPGRTADDVAADLDAVGAALDAAFAGAAVPVPALADLPPAIARNHLPRAPFEALIDANRRDQVVTDYRTRADLESYCALSAAPVGRLVLGVFGIRPDPAQAAASDAVCAGLQVLEHLQDVGEDARRGRIYLPGEDRARYGVTVDDLTAAPAPPRLRALLADLGGWAGDLLHRGSVLVGTLHGWPRVAVAGYVAGGAASLAALRRAGWDPSAGVPRRRRPDTAATAARTLTRGRLR